MISYDLVPTSTPPLYKIVDVVHVRMWYSKVPCYLVGSANGFQGKLTKKGTWHVIHRTFKMSITHPEDLLSPCFVMLFVSILMAGFARLQVCSYHKSSSAQQQEAPSCMERV